MAPTDGQYRLQSGTYAQPLAERVPYPNFEQTLLIEARRMLYYGDADDDPQSPFSRDIAAFRFLVFLYGHDDLDHDGTPDVEAQIRANFEDMDDWYGPAELERAAQAQALLEAALAYAPRDEQLHDAVLDLFYDRALGLRQFVKARLRDLELVRMGLDSNGQRLPDDQRPSILDEINVYAAPGNGVLASLREVYEVYVALLNSRLGLDTSTIRLSPDLPVGTPLGYYIFRERMPERAMMAAQYLDANNQVQFVPTAGAMPSGYPVLYEQYKDIVLLFEILREEAEASAEAARLNALLIEFPDGVNEPPESDPFRQAANSIIAQTLERSYLEGNLLLGTFPSLDPDALPRSGLAPAINGWRKALLDLADLRRVIDGDLNILGFNPDFLLLTTGFSNEGITFFDSYNTLTAWMNDLQAVNTRPIPVAIDKYDLAQGIYTQFRGYNDQLANEFSSLQTDLSNRLLELVGNTPDDPQYNPANPKTGEIADQLINVESAKNQILLNRQEMDNVRAEVEIEIERRAVEERINNAIGQVQVAYGNKRAGIQEDLAEWEALQAGAQGTADTVTSMVDAFELTKGAFVGAAISGIVNGANTAIQVDAELQKGQLKAQMERLGGLEQAEITSLNDQLLDAESKARIKTLMLNLATLAIESKQSELTLRQEINRLSQLYKELAQAERNYQGSLENLSQRYYADPVHYMRVRESVREARESFVVAQRWAFYIARALEYKWVKPFRQTIGSREWSIAELFRLRNALEVNDMLAAMEQFNANEVFGPGTGTNTDVISIRRDILGIAGDTPENIAAFREFLRANAITRFNGDRRIAFNFGTVISPPGSQFYLPTLFESDGSPDPFNRGSYLDKIQWVKINVAGNHSVGRAFINATLSDGGLQMIRRKTIGSYDPQNPQVVANDTESYSSRIWFYTGQGDNGFEFRERLTVPIRMELSYPDGVPLDDPDLSQVPENTFFKERSVANSQWTLTFTIFDASQGGTTLLNIDEVEDIEVLINHRFTPRL